MGKANVPIYYAFNKGIIDKLGLARADLKRTSLAAEQQDNWMPRVLGSMMLRPGLEYIGKPRNGGDNIRFAPFIYSNTDTALLEFTDVSMGVWVDDNHVHRDSVSTTITNGTFTTDLSSWTDADETGATSSWVSNGGTGCMSLVGTGYNSAKRYQAVTIIGADIGQDHDLRITVARAPVKLRVGSTIGGDEYISETDLGVGIHSLVVIPTGTFYVQFQNSAIGAGLVDSVTIDVGSAAILYLPTPWADANVPLIRWEQSADVVFVACAGIQQRKIERRANGSWSIVLYQPDDGPFLPPSLTNAILTPSAQTGDITLTASKPTFKSGHVGALFRMRSGGQNVTALLAGSDQYSDPIRVVGVGTVGRHVTWTITGTWVGTLTLQRSMAEPGSWTTYITKSANDTGNFDDNLDNEIVYYRWGFRAGAYTSGSATITLNTPGGGIVGIVRITSFSTAISVGAQVLKALGGTDGSADWSEGTWSDYRGWPSCVVLDEGRLDWFGKSKAIHSVSDAYASFDDTLEGDAGPIQRSIGKGPVDNVNWALSLLRLIFGADGAEWSARASSMDEPLTPSDYKLKRFSTEGSAKVQAVEVDSSGFFVDKSQGRLMQAFPSPDGFGYQTDDASKLVQSLLSSGIKSIAVQRKPDTRIHCVLNNGRVAVLVFDTVEEVAGWVSVSTNGTIEDAVVLPGTTEDQVYYSVRRDVTVAAVETTRRMLEKWAMESECVGGDLNKQADGFVIYDGAATTTITLPDLESAAEGEEVVVWGDGKDQLGLHADNDPITRTVTGGSITLPVAVSKAVIGRPYHADFKSAKLAYASEKGTALNQRKRIGHIGLILADTHNQGLEFGPDFQTMDRLPLLEDGVVVDPDHIYGTYDKDAIEFPGEWSTDPRICLRAIAPRCATVLFMMAPIEETDKS